MRQVFICHALRTPIGKYAGALAPVRADDLAAVALRALMAACPSLDPTAIDDVVLGCANQAGEDNRNVARMALLLSGLPETVSGSTVNRLCGSGMNAVGIAAQAIMAGEAEVMIAGGVESMSRAPYVVGKADSAFSRGVHMEDTTIGWRFVNPAMQALYGTDSMPQTAENVAMDFHISREDQDAFALRSQEKTAAAQKTGLFVPEICPVTIPRKKGEPVVVTTDEHPRLTSLEVLAGLKPVVHPKGTVTAGNASGVNDGAAALLLASEDAVKRYGLKPLARVLGMRAAGVPPRVMGIGPVPAMRRLLDALKLGFNDFDIIELNEAFASQALAVLRESGLSDNDPRVNPQGGAISLGHPLGMSGARLVLTATLQLQRSGARRALCSMCVGVGQGIALAIERV